MISNGTKLIKGKYERPAVAVAGEQKNAKETFAKIQDFFPPIFRVARI